jgi:adenosylmethionine-8-amino-7-oxononanoate aminotransferase
MPQWVLMTEHVYAAIADAAPDLPIGHGYTYSAHPVSAAVGLEVLRLYLEGGLLANGQAMGEVFGEGLMSLADHPLVGDVRSRGLLAAVELVTSKEDKGKFDPSLKLNERLAERGYANSLIFRAFADDVLGFAPPLCCGEIEIGLIIDRLRRTLDEIAADPEIRRALR